MRPATTVTAVILALLQQSPPDKPTVPARAEVLVLGVYHMSNPGHDIFNMQADDVLAPKRQAEITQVMAVLKKIQPTQIALERDPRDKPPSQDYADYLAGQHGLPRNEIEHLGFRLPQEIGPQTALGVDCAGELPHPRL